MEAFRVRFIAAELLSHKEGLFEEAAEEWYAQRDPDEVDWVECDCIRIAEQFGHLMEEYRERTPSITNAKCGNTFRKLPLAQTLYITEVYQLEVDWITWHRDYAYNKM